MQVPGRTSIPNGTVGGGTVYTDAQVLAQLAVGGVEAFAFDWLSITGQPLGDVTPFVVAGTVPEIVHDSTLVGVKRSLRIQLMGNAPLVPLSDQIRVHYLRGAPDGGWLDFLLGTFLVNAPTRHVTPGLTGLDYTCTDYGQLLLDAPFIISTGLAAGTPYIAGLKSLANLYGGVMPLQFLIPDSTLVLPSNLGWVLEDSRVGAVNTLLQAINYGTLWVDEWSRFRSDPIPDFNTRAATYTFDTTAGLAPVAGWDETPDLTRAANTLVVVGEDPQRNAVYGIYINDSAASRVSTVRWHPKVKVIRDSTVPNSAAALVRARVEAQAASRVWSELLVPTLPWPLSQERDFYGLIYSTADEGVVSGKYLELGWTFRCATGQPTLHRLTRVEATK